MSKKHIYHGLSRYQEIGIYKITCLPTNKIYIGSSHNIGKRFIQHISSLRSNHHRNKYLQRAWNKYGFENFTFTILQPVTNTNNLLIVEEQWISLTQSTNPSIGYNLMDQCISPGKGRKLSPEVCKRMSEYRKGKPVSIEGRELKPVEGFDNNGNTIISFSSIREAVRNGNGNINRAIKTGIRSNGYYWRYKC